MHVAHNSPTFLHHHYRHNAPPPSPPLCPYRDLVVDEPRVKIYHCRLEDGEEVSDWGLSKRHRQSHWLQEGTTSMSDTLSCFYFILKKTYLGKLLDCRFSSVWQVLNPFARFSTNFWVRQFSGISGLIRGLIHQLNRRFDPFFLPSCTKQ